MRGYSWSMFWKESNLLFRELFWMGVLWNLFLISFTHSSSICTVESCEESPNQRIQNSYSNYSAVIIGSTGAVGGNLLKELLLSKNCISVTSIGRKKVELEPSLVSKKLTQYVINMENLEKEAASLVKGHDIAFNALGVGQPSRVPQEQLYREDVQYAASFAKICKDGGIKHINLLGSTGADANSFIYYLRFKAEAEQALISQHFDRVSLFRPSLLVTKETRYGIQDSITQYFFPKISWMLPSRYREIKVEDLARAMRINAERQGNGVEILEYSQFVTILEAELIDI